jgi:hypothetical protein
MDEGIHPRARKEKSPAGEDGVKFREVRRNA